MLSPICVRWCQGLSYSHLLQRRAAVKAGQMLYLVVGQLPATIHKAHKQWAAVIAAWEMMAPARVFGYRFSSVSMTGQSFCGWVGWVIGFHSTVIKQMHWGSVGISSLFFFLVPLCVPLVCTYTHSTLRRGSCSHRSGGSAESPARVSVL